MLAAIARPLGMLLKIVFDFIGDYGYSIIVFTVLIKVLLLPFNIKQTESTKKMNEISPKMKELQKKYKGDQQTLNAKMLELYKEHNYSPVSGCLPALLQMPVLFALFYVLQDPVKYVFQDQALYNSISKSFWWLTDLGRPETAASIFMIGKFGIPILAILSAVTSYIQMKMISPTTQDPNQAMMTKMFPFISGYITATVPSGLAIYWIVGNIFTIAQQYFSLKPLHAGKEVK